MTRTMTVPASLSTSEVEAACRAALGRVAPLWSLESFVAVNPWFGMADLRADEAAVRMARVAGARSTMERSWYLRAIDEGRITDVHLAGALASAHARSDAQGGVEDLTHAGLPRDVAGLRTQLAEGERETGHALVEITAADAASRISGTDWVGFVTDRVSRWAADYFDEGQAAWVPPWSDEPLWQAWRADASVDRTQS